MLVGVNKLCRNSIPHSSTEKQSTIKCYVKGGDKKPVGGELSFLLNCEAFPRVRKIVLASSQSKLYLDGSLAVSGGETQARTNEGVRLRLGSGVSNLRG